MLDDLKVATTREKATGSMILILMNANTKHDAKEMKGFYQATGLNCLASAAISGTLPRTYDRGAEDTCVDLGIGCDENLDELIGLQFEPFYSTGIYDHRGLTVDLNIKNLLGGTAYDTTKSTCRWISEKRPATIHKYNDNTWTLMQQHNLHVKLPGLLVLYDAEASAAEEEGREPDFESLDK